MTTTRRDERMRSATHAWMRALERTAAIGREPALILPLLIDRLAEQFGEAPALTAPDSHLSYRALAEASRRVARWGLAQQLEPGEVVCLLMKNCPEYLAIWLGLSRIGVTVALVNTNLAGEALRHALEVVQPRLAIAGSEHTAVLESVRCHLPGTIGCWAYGGGRHALPRLDRELESLSASALTPAERALPAPAQRALFIYTSGTTGLPKAASVSHQRLMQWSVWFA